MLAKSEPKYFLQAPLWPLALAVFGTLASMAWVFWWFLQAAWTGAVINVYVWAAWCVLGFCFVHRLVYFYHVRRARVWVFVVALPLVLLWYPLLFLSLLWVAAWEKGAAW